MIQRINILTQFTLATLLITIALSAGLSYILEKQTSRELIRNHVEVYPRVVKALVADHPEFYDFLKTDPGTKPGHSVSSFLQDLTHFGNIYRVKVWNRDGTVIWSDITSLIGKSFSDNQHFRQAITGQVSYELARPSKSEHLYESSLSNILEIYTPVSVNGEVIGVVELYESDKELFTDIIQTTRQVRLSIAASGGILYFILFFIYLAAHQRHEKAVKNLWQAQDATIFSLAYQAELRDIETGLHLERTTQYLRILADELRRQKNIQTF